jgi:hypothetical protein
MITALRPPLRLLLTRTLPGRRLSAERRSIGSAFRPAASFGGLISTHHSTVAVPVTGVLGHVAVLPMAESF